MRVVVERWDCLGDVLVGTSVLPGLRAKYPDVHIIYAVHSGFEHLLLHNPYINEIVYEPPKIPPDVHIVLNHDPYWNGYNKPAMTMAQAHCLCAGVEFHPPQIFLTDEERKWAEPYANRVVVAHTCGWRTRTYPYMREVVRELKRQGVPLLQIDMGNSLGCDAVKCTIRQAAAIMEVSQLYLGVDTVFLHIAAAFRIPMVVAMGATGIENQYMPNATVIRQYPWTTIFDERYANGIDVPPAEMLVAFSTRWPTTNLMALKGVVYTDGNSDEIVIR